MTKIILDTNIILRQPKVLGLQIPDTTFLVPLDVIEELNIRANNRGASFDRRIDLIEKASHQGTVSIINTDAPTFIKYRTLLNSNKISGADLAILAVAIEFKNKGESVKIATQDKEIWRLASSHNIDILSESDISNLLSGFKEPSTDKETVQKDIVNYERTEKSNLWKGIFIGAVATLIAVLIYNNLQRIISTINIWGTISVILLLGIGLFVFREKKKLSYGVFEFFVGVVAIIMLFQPDNFDFSKLNFNIDFNIKLLGGLYIMVRGQDNIVKALKDTKVGLILKDKYGIGT